MKMTKMWQIGIDIDFLIFIGNFPEIYERKSKGDTMKKPPIAS
jgi:hypothetical protein